MGAEKIIERSVRKYLKEQGYISYKIHVGQYGPLGFPDLLIIKHGITGYLEVKAPGKVPEPIQIFQMSELRRAGCVAEPVWSVRDAVRALKGNM